MRNENFISLPICVYISIIRMLPMWCTIFAWWLEAEQLHSWRLPDSIWKTKLATLGWSRGSFLPLLPGEKLGRQRGEAVLEGCRETLIIFTCVHCCFSVCWETGERSRWLFPLGSWSSGPMAALPPPALRHPQITRPLPTTSPEAADTD